ncbi:MAG: hypothetical protein NTU54_02665 [Candidatus Omnitrophica bacterium]|nr:hypothetical protein [Candidatus Omnitrophota bacterium]
MENVLVKLRDKKGIALITTFLVMTALLIYSAAFVNVSINQNMSAERFKRRTRAFSLAEAGLDQAITWLRAQGAPPIGDKVNPWGSSPDLRGGSFNVAITDLGVVGGVGSIRRYKVTSTGSFGNISRVLTNYMQVDNFARYTWFTNSETFYGTTVWFWSQDHLDGTIQTNAHFNIYGNPVFAGMARSGDNYIRYYNNGNNKNLSQLTNPPYDNPDFQQGVDFGVNPITMPTQALTLRSAATSSGFSLEGDTTVVLNNNTMNVTNSKKKWDNQNMALPTNGALFVSGGDLTISGTLNGRLTAGSSQDILIPSSIVYADSPKVNPNSTNVLGLIAEHDAMISYTAPTDIEIDGCIMTMSTSFMMENWWAGPPKGTLTMYGGIIQRERGPVGTFNGSTGQKVSGYSKNYAYDSRLVGSPPPFMPTTGDYVTLSWEED